MKSSNSKDRGGGLPGAKSSPSCLHTASSRPAHGGGGSSLRAIRRIKSNSANIGAEEDGTGGRRRRRLTALTDEKRRELTDRVFPNQSADDVDATVPDESPAGSIQVVPSELIATSTAAATTDAAAEEDTATSAATTDAAAAEDTPTVAPAADAQALVIIQAQLDLADGTSSRVGEMTTRIEKKEEEAAVVRPLRPSEDEAGAEASVDGTPSAKLKSLVDIFGARERAVQGEKAATATAAAARPQRKSSAVTDASNIRSLRTIAPVVVRVESTGL